MSNLEQAIGVRETLIEAGQEFGLRQIWARAYASVATESGWIACTVPAVYSGDSMKGYRDDVARVFASMYAQGGERFKYIDMPAAFYASSQFDRVEKSGTLIGVLTLCSYSSNVRGWISICMINEDDLAYGDEVELVWGEPDGGSANPAVERHTQTTIRATMSPRPFSGDKK